MPKRLITPEDLLTFQLVGDAQIHPSGDQILFVKKHIGEKNNSITNLFSVTLDGTVKQWTSGELGAGHGRFSPDGRSIAFISGREKPGSQIFTLSLDGGEAVALTHLPEGSVRDFKWSPDGKRIAFTFRETHPDWTEKAKKEREEKGLSTPPRMMDEFWYRLDGDGYFMGQRHRLFVIDVATGKIELEYKESAYGWYSYDWTRDSEGLIVAHPVSKHPMRDKPNDQLFHVPIKGKATKLPGLPPGDKGNVAVSPDGKWIAYLGNPRLEDPWGVYNNRLYVVPIKGGEPKCLTENDDYCLSVMTLSDTKEAGADGCVLWSPDSQAIYVNIGHHGEMQLAYVPVSEGGVRFLTEGHHGVVVGNLSKDGEKFACVVGDAVTIPEVGVYELSAHPKAPRKLTHFNEKFYETVELSKPDAHWLESTDGVKVHTWIMRPPKSKNSDKLPAILQVHGGPHTQYGWTFFHEFQLLAAAGYTVVFSNPRGSKGYGEAFCGAIKGDWGHKDWEDIQTVTRWMLHHPGIHAGQVGIMGGSYGGYMTNWAVGHTHDFKAAITDRCVSNMISMSGNSDFAHNKDSYFGGCAWSGIDEITPLWKQSPIAFFDKVKTPMLIIHSEGDLRCNIEQSEQVFTALQMQGIESRFVRYPVSTSHGMSRMGPPDLRLHRLGEILKWWKKHLS